MSEIYHNHHALSDSDQLTVTALNFWFHKHKAWNPVKEWKDDLKIVILSNYS